MEEKKHVGRPTNEEVANRKKKKVIKYSLITIVSVLLVGGIVLFLNRDNIDFSSLMGASIFKRYNYVVNYYGGYFDESTWNNSSYNSKYDMYLLKQSETKELKDFKDVATASCKVSNSRYASCYMNYDGLFVTAKKKGNVNIKVTGLNKKGKKITKTIRVKIGKDYKAPVCKISAGPLKTVKKGSTVDFTVSCNENVVFSDYTNNNEGLSDYMILISFSNLNKTSCAGNDENRGLKEVKKINNKTYKITYLIMPDLCSASDYKFAIISGAFKDVSGNVNSVPIMSDKFSIK